MKKNKTKKRLGILAMALLLIVAIGATAGTTLAKYVSSASINSKSATVASWGYTVTANADDLFSKEYNIGVKATGTTVDVKGTSDVVAPGTGGSTSFSIIGTGTTEVETTITITIGKDFSTPVLKATTDYYPLVWKVNNTVVGTDNNVTGAALASTLASALSTATSTSFTSGTDSSGNYTITATLAAGHNSISLSAVTISWEWAFSNGNDDKDTLLGQLASEGTSGSLHTQYSGSVTTVSLSYSIAVEQIQNSTSAG